MESEEELKGRVNVLVTQAGTIKITSHSACEQAVAFLRQLKSMKKKVLETMDPICKSAYTTWKTAGAAARKALGSAERG